MRTVERIGHRGAKREFPENTIPAFERAFERGADAVELDVHATRDGVVVVNHDPTVHDPDGALLTIADTDWDVVRRVRFGDSVGLPRLADVLDSAPAGATVYVEIKGVGIEHLVARTVRESQTACAVHSFDHGAIATMQRLAPAIPRGILFESLREDITAAMRRTGARDVWPHWKLVDPRLVGEVHEAGGRVIVWTVNDVDVARRLIECGVDGLCGDDVRIFDQLGV